MDDSPDSTSPSSVKTDSKRPAPSADLDAGGAGHASKRAKGDDDQADDDGGEAHAGNAVAGTSAQRKHPCDWPNCTKSFSRVDHLSRHKLNRCQKVFVRQDLLIRHVERHERRENGGITDVAKGNRLKSGPGPSSARTATPAAPSPTFPEANSVQARSPTWGEQQAMQQVFFQFQQTPQQPPFSSHFNYAAAAGAGGGSGHGGGGSGGHGVGASGGHGVAGRNGVQATASSTSTPSPGTFASNELSLLGISSTETPSLQQQPMYSFAGIPPHNSAPQPMQPNPPPPDSGAFTPAINPPLYAGPAPSAVEHTSTMPIFDLPGSNGSSHREGSIASSQPLPGLEDPFNFLQASFGAPFVSESQYDWLFDATGNFDVTLGGSRPASPGHEYDDGNFGFGTLGWSKPLEMEQLDFGEALQNEIGFGALDPGTQQQQLQQQFANQAYPQQPRQHGESDGQAGKEDDTTPIAGAVATPASVMSGMDFSPNNPEAMPPVPPRPPADPSTYVDSATRTAMLDYLGPEWVGLRGDKRMSRASLQNYMRLYWERVSETQAPGIHRGSFRPEFAPTPLLLSMMLLGCYFAEAEAHQLALKLHPFLRGKVICSSDFRPRAQLWLHQTALLIIVFGKLCSNRLGHEMSHIHWSSVVTLSRRSGLFSQRSLIIPEESKDNVEVQWAYWIEEESAKRLAHIQFALDVEHAALFRHSPTLSAFQIQLTLPCDESEWDAKSAQEWAEIHARAQPAIPFISALKASLVSGAALPALNPFARISILHGLLSVAQDLQWRDHVVGLSQPERRANNWRAMISAAYNSWKSRLDTCVLTASSPTSQLLRASISLYAVAHITLSIDIHELQIFAGAENALGLVVSSPVFDATATRIRIWSASQDGRAATWHAAHFLRSSLQHWFQSGNDLAGCLHHRWSCYIATLVLFCYGTATNGAVGPRQTNHRDATMRYLDSMCTASPDALLTVPGKNNVICLCETICEYIQDSRWEIAQEGAKILGRLVPNWD